MIITFEKLRWQNFLSTGNDFTEVDLSVPGTTLITGPNGAGKSTMFEALTYALFGRYIRGAKKSELVNEITKRSQLVECEFRTPSHSYTVRRGEKPSILEIYRDGVLLPQKGLQADQKELEDQVLRCSFTTFVYIVILTLGTYTPFMHFTPRDRRILVEDILGLGVVSVMKEHLKKRKAEQAKAMQECDSDLRVEAAFLTESEKHLKTLRTDVAGAIAQIGLAKEENAKNMKLLLEQCRDLDARREELAKSLTPVSPLRAQRSRLDGELGGLRSERASTASSIKHFREHPDKCSLCLQPMDQEFLDRHLDELNTKSWTLAKQEDDVLAQQQSIDQKISDAVGVEAEISQIDTKVKGLMISYKEKSGYSEQLDRQLDVARRRDDIVKAAEREIGQHREKQRELTATREDLLVQGDVMAATEILLSDEGIKSIIVSQYLPKINKIISKYLSALELYMDFSFDENFEETIMHRLVDKRTYSTFSAGERARIDLALMFMWRDVARECNSLRTNILMFDEILDSSLDDVGAQELMKILKSFSDDSVYVISHKGDILYDKFDSAIEMKKIGNFSQIQEYAQ